MSLASQIVGAFNSQLDLAGVEITYTRGGTSVVLDAVPARVKFPIDPAQGLYQTSERLDFLMKSVSLGLVPTRGDKITYGSQTFVVVPNGERCYRYIDAPHNAVLRVHTQLL